MTATISSRGKRQAFHASSPSRVERARRFDDQREPVDRGDANRVARRDRRRALRAPDFAVDVDLARCCRDRARVARAPAARAAPSTPVDGRLRAARRAPAARGTGRCRRPRATAGTMTPRPTATPGCSRVSMIEPIEQADGAADAERAEARHLELEDQQRQAEHDQQQSRSCSPAGSESAKNASSRHRPPATPGRIAPGFQSSIGQSEHAERQQQVGDLRMRRWRRETAVARVISIAHASPRSCVRSVAVRPSKRVIVRPSSCRSRSSTSRRDEVDQRRRWPAALHGR